MPQYKLIYFNGRGRAEVPRWLFAVAGVQYEDVRYEMEDWKGGAKEKLNPPFGQLPVLSVDGVLYGQSLSISRYLAEQFGLAGKTDLEKLRADMVVHCCEDYVQACMKAHFESDETKKAEIVKKLKEEDLKKFYTSFEQILKQNKGGDGYFVADSLTWADIVFAYYTGFIAMLGLDPATFLADYPKLKALYDKVLKHPKIAEWIAKRPETKF